MYHIKGKYFWDNGKRMRNVLLVAATRFTVFIALADGDVAYESLEIVPSDALPDSEVIYIGPSGDVERWSMDSL